jgi:hypothetical protein
MSDTTTDPTREQVTTVTETSPVAAADDPIAAGRLGALRRAAQHVPATPVVVAAAALVAGCVAYSSYSSYSNYSKYCNSTCRNHTVYGTTYCNYSDYNDSYYC